MDTYIDALERVRLTSQFAKLWLLVDGLQYEELVGQVLTADQGTALFTGTQDESLAHAGPWLVDAEAQDDLAKTLAEAEKSAPICSWLITSVPGPGLVQLLQNKLDMKLPDGQVALLRYYDPRVLRRLALTLKPEQRQAFFEHIDEWHFVVDGRAMYVGRGSD